jgi:splicing suppressor protein 51
LFETIGEYETFTISHFEKTRQSELRDVGSLSPRTSYYPLSIVNTWQGYFAEISDKRGQGIAMFANPDFSLNRSFLQSLHGEQVRAQLKDRYSYFRYGTSTLSMALTILAALEESISELPSRRSLSIFLIGARAREIESSWVFEELLHLLPTLQTLKLMFIGPGSKPMDPDGKGDIIEYENCPGCKSLHKKRFSGLYGGLYHDYAEESYYQKPDLAVLFHSGRSQSEVESWAPTTRFLVTSSTLTLCTTWTKREAKEEEAELDQLGARFMIRPEENKWRSLAPIPDFLEGSDDEVYYANYYRYIFQGRGGKYKTA